MKKVLIAIAVVLLMTLSYMAGWQHTAKHRAASTNVRRVLYWVDPMHPDYKSDHPGVAPDCGMRLEPVYAESEVSAATTNPVPAGTVSVDLEKQQLFGIRIATVAKTSAKEKIRVLGRVVPDDTRVYRITSGSEGFVRQTFSDSVGELVKKDQKLATSYVGDTLSVASGFLAAIAAVPGAAGKDGSRTVPFPGALHKQGVSSLQGYSDRLRNLGMSNAQIEQMADNHQLPETIDIVSPVDGFILARSITPGQHFDRSTEFYRVADLTRVWILADLLGSDAQNIRPGTVARVLLTNQNKTFTARVSNVLPQVDPSTRTLKLRLEADNLGYALRPDMFVDVELPMAMPSGLTVPADALIDSGREQHVFVERSNGVFEPRAVQTGWRQGDRVQIVQGLTEGERVVSAGTFLVDSESRLRLNASASSKPEIHKERSAPSNSNGDHGLSANSGKVRDAACGMMIDQAKAIAEGNTLTRDGETYYFCSDSCKKKFGSQPEHYLALNPSGRRP